MERDIERLQSKQQGVQQATHPFKWVYSFKLLRVILDCGWIFHQHFQELRGKLVERLQAMRKVSGAAWGLECRILAITTHALIESVVGYGLATTGAHVNEQELRNLDTLFLNKAARRAVGTHIKMRIETMHFLADTASAMNHYIVKTANVTGRMLRAKGTIAQANTWEALKVYFGADVKTTGGKTGKIGKIVEWETEKIHIIGIQHESTTEKNKTGPKKETYGK